MSHTLPKALMAPLGRWQQALVLQNYSPCTVSTYMQAVQSFAVFLQQIGLADWKEVRRAEITGYFAKRLENDLGVTSARLYLTAVRCFFAYLQKQGLISHNPSTNYRLTGKTDRLPKLLDVDLVAQLLSQSPPDTPRQMALWQRDKAMFELLYSSGLRVGELVALDKGHLDLPNKLVTVWGKGAKPRILPVGQMAVQALLDYLPIRAQWQKTNSDDALFISAQRGWRITTRTVQLRLEQWAIKAGIPHNLHPHLLRHAFASHMLSASGDLRAVQELLGHSSLTATQKYTHLDFARLAAVYDSAHPRK